MSISVFPLVYLIAQRSQCRASEPTTCVTTIRGIYKHVGPYHVQPLSAHVRLPEAAQTGTTAI